MNFNIKIKMLLSDGKKVHKKFDNVCGIMKENGALATTSICNQYITLYFPDKENAERFNVTKIISIKIKAKKSKSK